MAAKPLGKCSLILAHNSKSALEGVIQPQSMAQLGVRGFAQRPLLPNYKQHTPAVCKGQKKKGGGRIIPQAAFL